MGTGAEAAGKRIEWCGVSDGVEQAKELKSWTITKPD